MDKLFIIAQCVSLVCVILAIIGIQFKSKTKILLVFVIIDLLYIAVYILLKKNTGAILVGMAMIKSLIFYFYSLKNKKPSVFILILLQVTNISVVILFWTWWVDLLLLAAILIATHTTWQNNMTVLRSGQIASKMLAISYNAFAGAYVAIAADLIIAIFTFISLYRYDIKKQKCTDDSCKRITMILK